MVTFDCNSFANRPATPGRDYGSEKLIRLTPVVNRSNNLARSKTQQVLEYRPVQTSSSCRARMPHSAACIGDLSSFGVAATSLGAAFHLGGDADHHLPATPDTAATSSDVETWLPFHGNRKTIRTDVGFADSVDRA